MSMGKEFYFALQEMVKGNQAGAYGMVVSDGPQDCSVGTKLLFDENGHEVYGEIAPGLFQAIQDETAVIIQGKAPKVLRVAWQGKEISIYIEPINPKMHLVILGGGHIALPLAAMGKMLGYQVTVVDDRPSFANISRFPQADSVVCADFAKTIREMPFDRNTYAIIVTRGHQHDRECLDEILQKDSFAYAGLIGSRRKVTALIKELRENEMSEEKLKNVYTPIGLDIGAQTPEEIAVSVLAEVIMVSNKGYSTGLGRKEGGLLSGWQSN